MPTSSRVFGYSTKVAGRYVGLDAADYVVPYQPSIDKAIHMMKINKQEQFSRLPDAFLFDTDNTLYAYDPVMPLPKAVRKRSSRNLQFHLRILIKHSRGSKTGQNTP